MRLPTFVNVSKKNTKALNLNVYRNLHYHHLDTQKKNFADEVKPLLRDKPRAEKVWIHYEIFAPRNGRLDTMNVGSITDKYFSDTLVEAGKIPDDNYEHIVLSTFSFGGVVPMNGHAIATINILKKESTDMRILLDQDDIQAALNAYVKTLNIPNAENATVELSINYDDSDSDNDQIEAEVIMGNAPVKNKGGRPRKTTTARKKPTPKEEESDVDTDSDGSDEGDSSDADSGGDQPSTDGAKEGTTEPAKERKSGNLFGDSDEEESSDSPTTSEPEAETAKEDGRPKLTKKKSSIFDAE